MDTRDRKDRGLLIPLLLGILLCASLCFLYFNYRNYRDLKDECREYEKSIYVQESDIRALDQELSGIRSQIEEYDHFDDSIEEVKKEFFAMAYDLENRVLSGDSEAKIAYLTFDDGPYLTTTHLFLDVLDEYDVKATFFYLLKDERYDGLYQQIIDSGHTLANHTASHDLSSTGIYRSVEAFLADLDLNRNSIEERFGYRTVIMRFPGGSPQAREKKGAIIEGLRERGYGYVDWDTATGDGRNSGSVDEYIHGVLDVSADYDVMVVLMHDYSYNTAAALPTIIEGLRDQGFIFLPLFYESVKVIK